MRRVFKWEGFSPFAAPDHLTFSPGPFAAPDHFKCNFISSLTPRLKIKIISNFSPSAAPDHFSSALRCHCTRFASLPQVAFYSFFALPSPVPRGRRLGGWMEKMDGKGDDQ
jgi:hypothetical protein